MRVLLIAGVLLLCFALSVSAMQLLPMGTPDDFYNVTTPSLGIVNVDPAMWTLATADLACIPNFSVSPMADNAGSAGLVCGMQVYCQSMIPGIDVSATNTIYYHDMETNAFASFTDMCVTPSLALKGFCGRDTMRWNSSAGHYTRAAIVGQVDCAASGNVCLNGACVPMEATTAITPVPMSLNISRGR